MTGKDWVKAIKSDTLMHKNRHWCIKMLCWKCKKEMDLFWQNPWRKLKRTNVSQMKTVLYCYNCDVMMEVIQTEWEHDLCNDDVPEEVR